MYIPNIRDIVLAWSLAEVPLRIYQNFGHNGYSRPCGKALQGARTPLVRATRHF